MFLYPEDEASMDNGTYPLIGFHLAPAGVPLEAHNHLSQALKGHSTLGKIVATAMAEFRDWSASYRKFNGNITLRFITADASNLAHTIQQSRSDGINTTGLYRQQYDSRPLVLDGLDYVTGKAPLVFDVIDTSDLCDHLGPLVLLTAIAPLLHNSVSSVLYTEVMAKRNRSSNEILEDLLCGDIPTLSSILGLFPIDYWANTSPLSVYEEEEIAAYNKMKGAPQMDCSYLRMRWKRPVWLSSSHDEGQSCVKELPRIRFEARELTDIIYHVYLHMFRNDDYAAYEERSSSELLHDLSFIWYQRAGFASILRFFETRIDCNWEEALAALLQLVENRPNCWESRTAYLQGLIVYLRIFGRNRLLTAPGSASSPVPNPNTPIYHKWVHFRGWKEIPLVVCVTLKVPRSSLRVFAKNHRDTVGAPKPAVQCVLQDSGLENMFEACHLAFGNVRTKGEKYTDSFEVHIEPDNGS